MANDITIQRKSVVGEVAQRYGMEPDTFEATIRATCMPTGRDEPPATREEFAAFIVVCKEHGLNPVTREIYAMRRKGGGLIPVVSVDGWLKKINEHPQMDGMEFIETKGDDGNLVSVTCRLYRKDRSRPVEVTEYLAECVRPTEPWKMKHRMMRHKTLIQAGRYAFGFAGIYDEDEAEKIASAPRDVTPADQQPSQPTARSGPPRGVQEPKVIEHQIGPTATIEINGVPTEVKIETGATPSIVEVDRKFSEEDLNRAAIIKAGIEAGATMVEDPLALPPGAKPAGPPRGVSKAPAADPRKAYKWAEIQALFQNQANMAVQMENIEPLEQAHANLVDAYEFTSDELDMLNKIFDEAEGALN